MIWLTDPNIILFAAKKNEEHRDTTFQILVPKSGEEDFFAGGADKTVMSDLVIFYIASVQAINKICLCGYRIYGVKYRNGNSHQTLYKTDIISLNSAAVIIQ